MNLSIKAIATMAAMLLAAPTVMAENPEEPADTVVTALQANNIVVTQSDEGLKIVISGYGENKENDYCYTSKPAKNDSTDSEGWNLRLFKKPSNKSPWTPLAFNRFYVGGAIDTRGDVDVAYWRSVEVGIQNVIGVEYAPWRMGPRFKIGAGFGYRRVAMHKNSGKMFFRNPDGDMGIADTPANTTDQHSSIDIFHLDIPFSITQPIYKNWAFSLGAMVNFNTYVTGNAKYKVLGENEFDLTPGSKIEESYKHLKQRPVTVDFTASIGYLGRLAVYTKYSPMSVFKEGAGPRFRTLSIGLIMDF